MAIIKGGVERKKGVGNIYTPDSLVLDEVIPDDLPGINSTKINSDIEIEGLSTGGSQAETLILQFNAADYTVGEIVEFSGFGFTPKKVIIQGSVGVGLGYFNNDGTKKDQTTNRVSESGHLMYLDGGSGGSALFTAFLDSFTNDGFKIKVDSKTNDFFFCYATCFSQV